MISGADKPGPGSFCMMMPYSKEFLTLSKQLLDLWMIQNYEVGQDIPDIHVYKTWCHLCTDS